MDAFVGVWLSSILGAGAFSAAGYVLGQRGVVVPGLHLPAEPVKPATLPAPPKSELARINDDYLDDVERTVVRGTGEAMPGDATPTPPAFPAARAAAASPEARSSQPPSSGNDDLERPTVVPKKSDHASLMAAIATIPPPRPPSLRVDIPFNDEATKRLEQDLATAREELREARQRAEKSTAAEAKSRELERQVEALRNDLRQEVAARATAEARAEELADRLATASEDAASLRHKVSTLDRQTKQLREALQGRVRALTTSEWHRRRELEDAEEVRLKLKDVYDKLERNSLPPGASTSLPPPSLPPASLPPASLLPAPPAATIGGERDELLRLREENRLLRQRALGTSPPKRPSSRGSAPEIDLDLYRSVLDLVVNVAGVRGAVIADELGSLIVGSGELAEGLAAFGAYIRDASTRSERLLPLDVIDEIAIKDKLGMVLSTRLLAQAPAELSLVLLGAADASISTAKKLADQRLRARA